MPPTNPIRIMFRNAAGILIEADALNPFPVQAIGINPSIPEENGVFVFDESSAAEQDALELIIASRSEIGSIWFDFVNVTRDTTIRVYHKIDGVNYSLVQTNNWITTDSDGVLIDGFTAFSDVKVSFECDGAGAGNVNVPYAAV